MPRALGQLGPYRPAKGSRKNGWLRIVCSFDDETFGEINARAEAANRSFSAQVLDLVEVGLETLKADGQ